MPPPAPAAAAGGKEKAPELTPELKAKLEQAKEVFFHLNKGVKNIALYRHNTSKYGEYLQKAHEALTGFCEKHQVLQMKVETQDFQLYGIPGNPSLLPQDGDDQMPYKFYMCGIRQLIFREGITLDELVQFTLISITNYDLPQFAGEDALSMLWKGSFEHLEYVVVEGFKIDGADEEDVKVEVDKVVNYLQARLRSDNDDYIRFARVSAEDLDQKLEGVDQIRGAVIAGESANDKLKSAVQAEVKDDESTRLMPKLVLAVFQVIDDGADDRAALEEVFQQLLDALLLQEDFASINQILVKFRGLERDPAKQQLVASLRGYFLGQMSAEARLRRLGEVLSTGRPRNPQDFFRYLSALDSSCVPVLLDVLDRVDVAENRKVIVDALVILGKETPEPFLNRLNTDRSNLVRDMLFVVDKIDFPDKMKMFASVLKNPNLAVRLEALGVVAKSKTEGARTIIVEALGDPSPQVRMASARLLPLSDPERASKDLLKVIKDAGFAKRDPKEREATYAALGSCNVPNAVQYLAQLLVQKAGLLNKKKVAEEKLLAIAGLANCPSIPSYKLLQSQAEDKSNEAEVISAARRAGFMMKKTLFGEQGEA